MTEKHPNAPLIDPAIISGLSEQTLPAGASVSAAAPKNGFWWGTGRRKSSVARVRIRLGEGNVLINERKVDDYFRLTTDRTAAVSPLKAVNSQTGFDVFVNVSGGGTTGQAGAVMLGLARALKNYNPDFLKDLREGGYLTRDSREVERKKPGKSGARKSFQFSKR
jgi:small subunit ribosomal protein S9